MAEDSKREQIIQYWVNKFESDDTVRTARFNTVKRMKPSLAELGNFTGPQLPLLAVVAKLPVPIKHIKTREPGGRDAFISALEIEFIAYAKDNDNPDTLISDIADDLWAVLYSDTTSGEKPNSLTVGLDVRPEPNVAYFAPYIAVKMVCSFEYYHTIGGI